MTVWPPGSVVVDILVVPAGVVFVPVPFGSGVVVVDRVVPEGLVVDSPVPGSDVVVVDRVVLEGLVVDSPGPGTFVLNGAEALAEVGCEPPPCAVEEFVVAAGSEICVWMGLIADVGPWPPPG